MSQQEAQLLLNHAGDLVATHVQKRGGFRPFAIALTTEGLRIVHVQFTQEGGEPVEQLRTAIQDRVSAGVYYAVSVADETEILDPESGRRTRAARIEVEHRDVPPVTWYWPFEESVGGWRFGGASGEGYLQEGERRFFKGAS